MKTWQAIREQGTDLVDMSEADFLYLLRVLCREDVYPQLREVLNSMTALLTIVGPETVELLRDFFSGPRGASALQKGEVSTATGRIPGDCWDVYDATVDEQVC
jgi:hypothetical protein